MGTNQVFLTDTRKQVLTGKYEGADSNERSHKSRIRNRSETALEELIQVAESPEIDNAEIFDPDTVARLIDALMIPEWGYLTPRWNFDGDPAEYRDRYQYQIGLYTRLDHTLRGYGDMLLKTHEPGEEIDGLIDTND